ncbi:MAG: hypothetical protein ACLURV_08200 [Gallintestinimicrobium sp.]
MGGADEGEGADAFPAGAIWMPPDKRDFRRFPAGTPGSRKRRGQEAASARVTVRLAAADGRELRPCRAYRQKRPLK